MSTPWKVLLIGCGVLLILGFGGCLVMFSFLLDQPEGVEVSTEVPARVSVGETYEIVARVRNTSTDERVLVDLDIADEYLEGAIILDSSPGHSDSMHVPIDNTVSYSFDLTVPPGQELAVIFTAEALQAGDFSGDLDFCIDSEVQCLSSHMRTVVSAAQ